jgi:hypothetical protein
MAEKRMFSKKITDSDAFIELSSSAQALYFHLNQGADDDGFNNQIQNAMFKAHATIDDLKVLMMKNFIIRFESGVIVIKHWRMHNTLRKDRYKETNFNEELNKLKIKENGAYTLIDDSGCQMVAKWLPQNSIDKNSIEKENIIKEKEISGKPKTNFDLIIEKESFSKETVERLNDFIKMRKSIKKPLTDRALKIIVNKLKKIAKSEEEMQFILDRSILNSWQDVYELKSEDKKQFIKTQTEEVQEYKEIHMTDEEYAERLRSESIYE